MAEEKILKNEILKDDELERVAGGNIHEINRDMKLMNTIGLIDSKIVSEDATSITSRNRQDLQRAWAHFGIAVYVTAGDFCQYYNSNGKEISRQSALEQVIRQAKRETRQNLNIYDYL